MAIVVEITSYIKQTIYRVSIIALILLLDKFKKKLIMSSNCEGKLNKEKGQITFYVNGEQHTGKEIKF